MSDESHANKGARTIKPGEGESAHFVGGDLAVAQGSREGCSYKTVTPRSKLSNWNTEIALLRSSQPQKARLAMTRAEMTRVSVFVL